MFYPPMSASLSICSNTMLADRTPCQDAISARRLPRIPLSRLHHDDDLRSVGLMYLNVGQGSERAQNFL